MAIIFLIWHQCCKLQLQPVIAVQPRFPPKYRQWQSRFLIFGESLTTENLNKKTSRLPASTLFHFWQGYGILILEDIFVFQYVTTGGWPDQPLAVRDVDPIMKGTPHWPLCSFLLTAMRAIRKFSSIQINGRTASRKPRMLLMMTVKRNVWSSKVIHENVDCWKCRHPFFLFNIITFYCHKWCIKTVAITWPLMTMMVNYKNGHFTLVEYVQY